MLRPSFEQNKAPRHGPYIHARFFLKCAFFLEMRVFPLCALFFAQMKVQENKYEKLPKDIKLTYIGQHVQQPLVAPFKTFEAVGRHAPEARRPPSPSDAAHGIGGRHLAASAQLLAAQTAPSKKRSSDVSGTCNLLRLLLMTWKTHFLGKNTKCSGKCNLGLMESTTLRLNTKCGLNQYHQFYHTTYTCAGENTVKSS